MLMFKASLLAISITLAPQALAACSPGDLAIGIATSFFMRDIVRQFQAEQTVACIAKPIHLILGIIRDLMGRQLQRS